MHTTNDSHNFLLMILQTALAYTQKLLLILKHIPIHFQIQCTILLESVTLFECLKLSLTNFMNTLTLILMSPIILFLPILFYTLS